MAANLPWVNPQTFSFGGQTYGTLPNAPTSDNTQGGYQGGATLQQVAAGLGLDPAALAAQGQTIGYTGTGGSGLAYELFGPQGQPIKSLGNQNDDGAIGWDLGAGIVAGGLGASALGLGVAGGASATGAAADAGGSSLWSSLGSSLFGTSGAAAGGAGAATDTASLAGVVGSAGAGAGTDALTEATLGAGPLSSLSSAFSNFASNLGTKAGLTSIFDIAKGALGVYGASQLSSLGKPSASSNAAGGLLTSLIQNPSNVSQIPGYQAGLDAVQRSGAANGYLGSGNMMAALAKYGSSFWNDSVRTLSGVESAGQGNPLASTSAALNLLGQSVNSIGAGVTTGLFGDQTNSNQAQLQALITLLGG